MSRGCSPAWPRRRRAPAGSAWRTAALLLCLVALPAAAWAQEWRADSDGTFTVLSATEDDGRNLHGMFDELRRARQELRSRWGLELPESVTVRIHPDLDSFREATSLPWFVSAAADRREATIELQRSRVLRERSGLRSALRHELFHLAQPPDWPRWRAEGWAMLFAGEEPEARPFERISLEELDALLLLARDRETLARAAATAYWLVLRDPDPPASTR